MPFWIICFVLCANVNPQNKCNGFRLFKPQGLYVVLYTSTCMEIGNVDCITVKGHITTTLNLRKDYMYITSNNEIFPAHKWGGGLLSRVLLERGDYPLAGPVQRIMQVSLFYKTMRRTLLCPEMSRELSRNTLLCVCKSQYL